MQVRRLNTLTPEPVRTGGFRNPGFWSPDSRSFVFSDGTNLKKMRVPDGAPEIVANGIATMVGGSWSDRGTLLIPACRWQRARSLRRAGGRRSPKRIEVTGLPEAQDRWIWWPEFLPDSDDFLFLAAVRKGRGV